ncbi:MAG: bifunctional riboflavin kinase/FAD synthetase [Flavobacteriaceae bacterium]|nr:bifunctional riboflavin kinase/FAD synthetase [Flavobacteriaceae bacterium]
MKSFNSIENFSSNKQTILTIGTFDGVHLGHQRILKKLLKESFNNDLQSTVLTFFPHPRTILNPSEPLKLINSIDERIELFKRSRVENLIIHSFDKKFSEYDPEKYVSEILVQKLNAKIILIGHDHKFGRNRSADINDLIEFGKKYDFNVLEIKAEELNDIAISSTIIRNSLNNGKINNANTYLGYDFSISGIVIKGNKIGKTIGFPTANIEVDFEDKLIPKNGVYLVYSYINNKKFFGMMNIGIKPTINENKKSIEVNLFDFNENLYGKPIRVHLTEFLRDEVKFDSLEQLKGQLEKDQLMCNYLINH